MLMTIFPPAVLAEHKSAYEHDISMEVGSPLPCNLKEQFLSFLASTHIRVGAIAQRWKTWRWSSQISFLLLEPQISISMLLVWSLCSSPTFCTSGCGSIASTDPVPEHFSKTLVPLCLPSPRMLPEDGHWKQAVSCSLQPVLESRNMFSAECCIRGTHFVSVLVS